MDLETTSGWMANPRQGHQVKVQIFTLGALCKGYDEVIRTLSA